jgi:hypothetical protein
MGIEIGTSLLTKALAGTTVAGAGVGVVKLAENEPPDKGTANAQAAAAVMNQQAAVAAQWAKASGK